MECTKTFISSFVRNEDGAAAVEYGLLVGLIAIAIITSVATMANNLKNVFGTIGNHLSNVAAGTGT